MTTVATSQNRSWRRWVGLGLILYGLAGLVLAAGGAVLVSSSFRGVDRLADTIVAQRNTLALSLETTAAFVANAATSVTAVDDVLADSVEATRGAATMARSLATAADEVAVAATFQIFGQQPLATVATSFTRVGADARVLADQLDAAGATLGGTTTETDRLRADLVRVSEQIRTFNRGLTESAVLDDIESGFDPPRLVLYGLLGWLAAQALAAVVTGVVLIVTSRRRRVMVIEEPVLPL